MHEHRLEWRAFSIMSVVVKAGLQPRMVLSSPAPLSLHYHAARRQPDFLQAAINLFRARGLKPQSRNAIRFGTA